MQILLLENNMDPLSFDEILNTVDALIATLLLNEQQCYLVLEYAYQLREELVSVMQTPDAE